MISIKKYHKHIVPIVRSESLNSLSITSLLYFLMIVTLSLGSTITLAVAASVENEVRGKNYQLEMSSDITVIPAPEDIIAETDVAVTMRDGIKLYVNIYRPQKPGEYPVVMSTSPYGKDDARGHEKFRGIPNTNLGKISYTEYTSFEAPDPGFWVPNGYVVIHADVRGTFKSEGSADFHSKEENQDYYDLIEWAARQEWSSGNVGLNGVSYLAIGQWHVAAMSPPHLKAIIPWEGASDGYRDSNFHGGIHREIGWWFKDWIAKNINKHKKLPKDQSKFTGQHLLLDEYWQRKLPQLEKISVPALISATWSRQGSHSRGSFEAFKRISSQHKWLFNHGRLEWEVYYSEEALDLQKRFFDYFLKGIDNGMMDVPRVRLEVRNGRDDYTVRYENEWPISQTDYVKLFLNARDQSMSKEPVIQEGSNSYHSVEGGKSVFDLTFEEDIELIGNTKLKLWVATDDGDDMDLFIGLKKLDIDGNEVHFYGYADNPNDMVSRGWLRVSHREKDEGRSTPWQPYLKHQSLLKLNPHEIVPVEIEILPSGTAFRKGETLRLIIQGSDIVLHQLMSHQNLVNKGFHTIYTGGKYDSHLLIPVAR